MGLVFWNSIHLEVASDSFCFLINSSWLLVFILFMICWKGIYFSYNLLHIGLIFSFHYWFRDLLREFDKKYEVLLIIFFLVFLLFLVSEGLLFVSFFWTTILNLRSYSLTLKTMPLFPWALLITGGMLLLTLPILSGALLMVLADLHSNTLLFDPIFGGDPIFYQHLFWFFGHPEVYILIIPAFGIISIIISGILHKIIFGNPSMIFAMSCISLLGSVVWGHHMYTVGLETDTRAYFSGVTILISLPTGTKIFNWLSTYLGNPLLLQLKTNSPFFGLLFLLMFTIGGSTGIILGNLWFILSFTFTITFLFPSTYSFNWMIASFSFLGLLLITVFIIL